MHVMHSGKVWDAWLGKVKVEKVGSVHYITLKCSETSVEMNA